MDLSIIVPLYNEAESLPELAAWIERVVAPEGYSYEILMVDDGSTDGSWDVVRRLAAENPAIHGLSFRRNYGKSAALYEGFALARGNVVITMDADLQDSPDEIPALYRMITEEGYDVVSGWKQHRQDNALTKNLPSKLYNATARRVTGIQLHDMNCGLKAYRNEVVKSIEVYGEMHRYIPYLAKNAGYGRIGELPVHHQKRKYGVSKFGLERFVNGFLDLMSLWFLSTFGKKPMHFFGTSGILMFLVGFVMTVWIIAAKLVHQARGIRFRAVTDQPLFYLALVAVLLGVMLFLAG
ncbi:MAG: glycosyltransferase family 2 protein, partial [Bacteroidales bacterium]|nr:glycosyltransferase family 2 protein [Bacteroidales bacterium]